MTKIPEKHADSKYEIVRLTPFRKIKIRKRKRDGKWVVYGVFSNGPAAFTTKAQANDVVRIDRLFSGRKAGQTELRKYMRGKVRDIDMS